jgi:protease IV
MINKTVLTSFAVSTFTLGFSLAERVAVFDLKGVIPETGAGGASPFDLVGNPQRPITHFDLVNGLDSAVWDEKVKAIVMDIDDAGLGLSQIQEVRRLLLAARAEKKDVWLFSQHYNIATALLGSAANNFVITPESGSSFHGLYGESMYFKDMLSKIGVSMDVVHIGDFKSAGEQFYRSEPSEYAKKQTDEMFDSLYSQLLSQIAEGRGLNKEQVEAAINKGSLNSNQLKDAKLVDAVEYKTDLIRRLNETYKKFEFKRNYKLPETGPPKIDGMMDFFKLLAGPKERKLSDPYIAIVPLEGAISDESIATVRNQIIKINKDANCKGLVLRVNSPGGSALASEVLWESTEEFKQSKRPFVVSMGDVAASGGYYVSAGADAIFAEPGTITGSIGVVGMKPVMGDALKMLGISTHEVKRGAFADMMNTSRPFSEEERKLVRDSMLEVYVTFKKRVTDGRGTKLKGDIDSLAGGRVYTGNDALKIGLIDQLGGLNEAIQFIVDKSPEDVELKTHQFPEPKNPMEALFQPPHTDKDEEFLQSEKMTVHNKLSAFVFKNDLMNLLGDQKKAQIQMFIDQMESVQRDKIQLIAPVGLGIMTK